MPAEVSVPSRGVGCIMYRYIKNREVKVSVPSRGVGCIAGAAAGDGQGRVSVPLRGRYAFIVLARRWFLSSVTVPSRGVGCIMLADNWYIVE